MKRPGEAAVAAGLIALAALAYAASFAAGGGVNAASTDSPMRLPRILLAIWGALGLVCLIRAVVVAAPAEDASFAPGRLLPFAGLVVLIVLAIPFLGYLVAAGVGVAGLLWILGERNPVRGGAAFLLLGPGLWFLFHHVLDLRLPVLLSGGMF